MPWRLQSEPTVAEKVCGGLSYCTFGIVGMIYMLFFSKGGEQSPLFRFHFFQSILLSIAAMLLRMGIQPLLGIIFQILGAVAPGVVAPLAGGVGIAELVVQGAFSLVLIYGMVFCFLGKFAEVPIISNVVRQNMRS